MENTSNDYHISFFKPTTKQALANRNRVVWLVLIWFVAIFGFHIVLKVIEKPTPEPVYTEFQEAWINITGKQHARADYQKLGQATLSVLGKIFITPDERTVLAETLGWSAYMLTPDSLRAQMLNDLGEYTSLKSSISDISNPDYIAQKKVYINTFAPLLGLSKNDARTAILPVELVSDNIESLSAENKAALPAIMEKYLIHNQSVLTDLTFLGFPFHYFYSAVFLLVLFIALCWIYCKLTDRMNAKLEIAD